uniref:Uncharacterized protein n=1 Tax=Nelumbo nucifera TaxID=4432 RepID=A0A822YL28_NELNU|nr:TPA_asm: hypothetical protein HUJ06_010840 [Nelumbo nucifera]
MEKIILIQENGEPEGILQFCYKFCYKKSTVQLNGRRDSEFRNVHSIV